jgi:hypothetical protein
MAAPLASPPAPGPSCGVVPAGAGRSLTAGGLSGSILGQLQRDIRAEACALQDALGTNGGLEGTRGSERAGGGRGE